MQTLFFKVRDIFWSESAKEGTELAVLMNQSTLKTTLNLNAHGCFGFGGRTKGEYAD
jgi:hypothetical protein